MLLAAAPAVAQTIGCESDTISVSPSPDGAWLAVILQETCTDGWFVTSVAEVVHLTRIGEETKRGSDVLAVDVGGGRGNGPQVVWVSPQRLQITVPNRSLVVLMRERLETVEIAVKFDPDDPEDRELFLKKLDLPSN
jgi:hypothetical protein